MDYGRQDHSSRLSFGAAVWPSEDARSATFRRTVRYIYTPLNPLQSEIRLLKVSCIGEEQIRIHVKVSTFSMGDCPAYQALSYHWGDWGNPECIFLGGYSKLVTRNLAAALRQLIYWEGQTKQSPYVWIDALCINQEDARERNHQVKKMRAIFEQAERIIISLGEAAENSHLAFKFARKLISTAKMDQKNGRLRDCLGQTEYLCAFHHLLKRPYWSRIWVVQEIHSARGAKVLCGEDSIVWTDLLQAQSILNSNQAALWNAAKVEPHLSDLVAVVWYGGLRGLISHVVGHEPSLFEVLRWHCLKLSSLPEDKVYAILGITTARDDPRIVIDYDRGAQQLYIDTTTYIIQSTKRLDVICGMQRTQRSNLDLPSWVVDWVDSYTSCLLDGSTGFSQAAGTSEAQVVFGQESKSLNVQGIYLGTISAVAGPAIKGEEELLGGVFALLKKFHQSHLILGPADEISLPELLKFFKNFTCGRILRGMEFLADQSDDDARRTLLGLFAFLASQATRMTLGQPLEELAERIALRFTPSYLETMGGIIFSDLENVLASRRFFICEDGLQGSVFDGFDQVDVGCKVCIFLGCSIPVVVKPIDESAGIDGGERFEVIGNAYVNGYMHGEGIVELEQQKLELRNFVLI